MNRFSKRTIVLCSTMAVLLLPHSRSKAQHESSPSHSVVKLYVTYQEYDAGSPWKKRDARSRSGYGCILKSNRILTTADIIRDHTLIKVTKSTSGEYYVGRVNVVDYDVNLAVLTVDDESFFSDLAPVELDPSISIDQPVQFLVFEDSDQIRAIPGTIVKITVGNYYLGWNDYLLYGATASFEGRKGGWSEPVFSHGKLVGLTMTYSSEQQYAKIIPAPIITHFLGAIKDGRYSGFPEYGFWCTTLRDPDFKKYLELPEGLEGVYLRHVVPGGSAEGVLRVGDVVTSVDGFKLDWDGNYQHPEWGRLDFSDRITRYYYPGDTIEIGVFRDGQSSTMNMKLKRFDGADYLVPVISDDGQPRYIIVGGLVIQELTRDYLKTWGKNWKNRANKKFLYYYNYEARNPQPDRKRIVVLNKVLPDAVNTGYQEMKDLVLSEVNGLHISEIKDVAEALRSTDGGFHRFTVEEYKQEIILDRDAAAEADKRIGAQYGIARMQNVD